MSLQDQAREFLALIQRWFDAQQLCDIQEGLAAQALAAPDRPEPPADYGNLTLKLVRERNEAAIAVKEAGERLAANLIASGHDAKAALTVVHYADRNGGFRSLWPHWEAANIALQQIALSPPIPPEHQSEVMNRNQAAHALGLSVKEFRAAVNAGSIVIIERGRQAVRIDKRQTRA